jgi:multidrug resistance efflux pump
VTGDRDSKLVQQGWATQQQGGTDRLTLEARDAAVAVATANITAQNAQLRVLTQQKNYQSVVAAFDGVMTQRNVDIGALVQADAANGTFLFILMQSDTIRIQLYVPQDEAFGVAPGTAAVVRVPEMPGPRLSGNGDAHCRRVAAGYANALDQDRCAQSGHVIAGGLLHRRTEYPAQDAVARRAVRGDRLQPQRSQRRRR